VRTLRLRTDDLKWRVIDGEVIAVDVRTSTYLSTNGSGAVLWHALVEGTTCQDLVARLVDTFGIDARRASADVGRFVDEVASRGLLEA
jgi:Coenzyme PQQ synthesis protein D (PqqD)